MVRRKKIRSQIIPCGFSGRTRRPLFRHGEFSVQRCGGIFPGPNVKRTRLDRPLFVLRTPKFQLVFTQGELNAFGFARLQSSSLETLELTYRPRSGTVALVNIDLRDGVARDRARIGDFD